MYAQQACFVCSSQTTIIVIVAGALHADAIQSVSRFPSQHLDHQLTQTNYEESAVDDVLRDTGCAGHSCSGNVAVIAFAKIAFETSVGSAAAVTSSRHATVLDSIRAMVRQLTLLSPAIAFTLVSTSFTTAYAQLV